MKCLQITLVFLCLFSKNFNAQVGIGTTTPNPSSVLDITSTDSGILIPRMLLSDRIAITTPAEGLLVYQTNDVEGFYYYDGTRWLNLFSRNSQIGVVPIGSIIAWHGSLSGTGALPDGWVRCSGGTVIDSDSPLDGQSIPDLNGLTLSDSGNTSSGRFLRGSITSGAFESDQSNNLWRVSGSATSGTLNTITLNSNGTTAWIETDDHDGFGSSDRYGFQLRGIENRPTNMSVIWIMRTK